MAGELYIVRKQIRDLKVRKTVYPRLTLVKELKVAGIDVGDSVKIVVYPNKIEVMKSNLEAI